MEHKENTMREMSFRGQSGRAYKFKQVPVESGWAAQAGVALFAARGPFGWRVVKLSALRGRAHDVQPIWAYADAERFGARAVFITVETDPARRQRIILDLENGLSPVCESVSEPLALAA